MLHWITAILVLAQIVLGILIANKWTGSGDISCEARGCAVDLVAEYAGAQGVDLIERDNESAVT